MKPFFRKFLRFFVVLLFLALAPISVFYVWSFFGSIILTGLLTIVHLAILFAIIDDRT